MLRAGPRARRSEWDGRLVVVGLTAMALVVGLAVPSAAYRRPGTTEVVTAVDSSADRDCERNDSGIPQGWQSSFSRDGRYVAFASELCDLVPEDRNPYSDVFIRDRLSAKTTLISVSSLGIQAVHPPGLAAGSYRPSISANGRYVAFDSDAANLVPGDTNAFRDVFVHDRKTGTTERVSVASEGAEAVSETQNLADSQNPSISANGRFVSFESRATNLVSDDTNLASDIFVHDRSTGTTRRVSVASDGSQADEASPFTGIPPSPSSTCASISGNGRFVAFRSWAEDLVVGDTNAVWDIFVHDRKTTETERVSVDSHGSQAQGHPAVYGCDTHAISYTGRYVVFASGAASLVPNDSAGDPLDLAIPGDVFVHDRKTHRTERLSVTGTGEEVPEGSSSATISKDGRFVAFMSASNELDRRDRGSGQLGRGDFDAYIHDRRSGSTEMIAVNPRGEDTEPGSCGDLLTTDGTESTPTAISADGRYVSFVGCSDELVPGDPHKGTWDEFLRDRGRPLRVGDLVAEGRARRISLNGAPHFARTGMAWIDDSASDGISSRIGVADELIGGRLVHRPQRDDLYVVLELQSMPGTPALAAATAGTVYGMSLQVDGKSYELRAASTGLGSRGETTAVFGLFTCANDKRSCTEVTKLKGGFGTTGERVTFSVPLAHLGIKDGSQISEAQAFTAFGTFLGEAVEVVDEAHTRSGR